MKITKDTLQDAGYLRATVDAFERAFPAGLSPGLAEGRRSAQARDLARVGVNVLLLAQYTLPLIPYRKWELAHGRAIARYDLFADIYPGREDREGALWLLRATPARTLLDLLAVL